MNDLQRYFEENQGSLIFKWKHYFDVYDRYFHRFRGKPVVIVEIGVFHGGSLKMWKDYFGPLATIHGVDIDPRCKAMEEPGVHIHIGSQSDRRFLRGLVERIPVIDIIIDDGGHTMQQQIISFEELYPAMSKDGVYVCEDLHTSYWLQYGGGVRRPGTFIEYSKRLVDRLNAWHSEERGTVPDGFTRSTDALHYYDSMLVIERRERPKPVNERRGTPRFSEPPKKERTALGWLKLNGLRAVNQVLRRIGAPSIIWGR